MIPPEPSRRRLLAGVVGTISVAGLAGCSSDSDESEEETEDADANDDQTSGTGDDSSDGDQSEDGGADDSNESDRDDDESGGEDDSEDGGQDEDSSTDDDSGEDGPDDSGEDGPDDSSEENEDDSSSSEDDSSGELDLREANVVGVEFDNGGAEYDFDVTLHHDDDGEDGYANWWQVERLDGSRLGRRELLHAHSRQPFTRSETIAVPEEVSCVVVRGHDQTHGYGGRAMVVNLETGTATSVDQGPEPQSFDGGDCP